MTRAEPPTTDHARLRSLQDQIFETGLCTRPGADPEHWFPDKEPGLNATTQRRFYEQAAAARCFGCPALLECREVTQIEEYGQLMQHGYTPHGIRAGLAPWMRLDLLKRLASKTDGDTEEEAA